MVKVDHCPVSLAPAGRRRGRATEWPPHFFVIEGRFKSTESQTSTCTDKKLPENIDIIEENFKDKEILERWKGEILENKMPTEIEDSSVKCEPMNGKSKALVT